ncbi:MAG: heavy-metal-associated domain-containing protein [Chitinophagaceae bacterium]|nr:heavy-metal-associated domain-containing protein [Chitinophagaceae bacterium]
MKRFLSTEVAVSLSFAAFSQIKPTRIDTIKTPQALCEPCKVKIEKYLKQFDGLLEINVNIRRGETKVKYVTDRINIEEIKTAIANCGFDAGDIPAAPDFYAILPLCCKKPEDGGIKPKTKVPVALPVQQ